ncbi:MAG TPA: phage major capsid protein [Jeotgalicoccus sp.]|nr:phage major capsid protein [Jeotgalicoccus sp.]
MTIEEVRSEITNKLDEMQRALDADDVEKAEAIKAEIAEYQEMIKQLEAELAEVEGEEQPTEEESEDKEVAESSTGETDVRKLEARIADLEKELEDKNEERNEESSTQVEDNKLNLNNEGEERKMTEIVEEVVLNVNGADEIRSAYQEFLVTGEKRNVTSTDEGVLVPEEVATSIENLMDELEGLDKLVDVKHVNSAIGKYPVRNADSAVSPLPTVEELEESPELGLRKLGDYKYEIKTHRGLVKASFEAIDDAVEVEKIINEEMAEAIVATKNKAILDALATLPAQEVADLDAIKTIVNTGVAKRYAKQIVVSTDVYDALDRMKDSNGQYLLQPSVTAASGTKLFGKDLVVVDAEVIGEGVMYIGSLKDAAILFLRKELYVNYEIWNQYGKVFTPVVRLDAGVKNPNAVVKVNFTAPVEA